MAKERPSRRSAPQGVSSAATLRARLSTYCICFLLLSRFMKITTTAGFARAAPLASRSSFVLVLNKPTSSSPSGSCEAAALRHGGSASLTGSCKAAAIVAGSMLLPALRATSTAARANPDARLIRQGGPSGARDATRGALGRALSVKEVSYTYQAANVRASRTRQCADARAEHDVCARGVRGAVFGTLGTHVVHFRGN